MRIRSTLPLLFLAAACTLAVGGEVDYRAERLALAARPGFDGYAKDARQTAQLTKAQTDWSRGQVDETVAQLTQMLVDDPVSIAGHVALSEVLAKRSELDEDPAGRAKWGAESQRHRATADALIASITQGTRCAAMEDACKVIGISEEDQVIRSLGGGVKTRQALAVGPAGTPFDVITITDTENGAETNFYFDISPFFHARDRAPKSP